MAKRKQVAGGKKGGAKKKRAPARRGAGFWGDVWGGIKKVGSWVKDNKALSKGADFIGRNDWGDKLRNVGLGRGRLGGGYQLAVVRPVKF